MLDPFISKHNSPGETIAILFAGIGDARHLLQTFQVVALLESRGTTRMKYHFTVNDVKHEVFARDFLFFMLLHEVADSLPPEGTTPLTLGNEALLALTTLYYIYIGQIMPGEIFDHLQKTITSTIDALDSGNSLPRWIRIDSKDVSAVKAVLQSWNTQVTKAYMVQRSQYGMDGDAAEEDAVVRELRAE